MTILGARGQGVPPTGTEQTFDHGEQKRSYRIYLPTVVENSETKVPLVFSLHGGGGNAATMSKAGWSELAEERGFLVVYPEGLNGHWIDG